MNITWAILMMALGSVGVQNVQADADVASVLQSAANTAIVSNQNGTTEAPESSSGTGTAAGTATPAPSALPGATASADGAPPMADPQPDAPKVKGVYVTAYSAGGSRMDTLMNLIDQTELNAMVIDIKDDAGYITYKTDNAELQQMGKPQPFIRDIGKLMERLKKHEVYPIARIVVFKDSVLAKKHPELSFVKSDGSVWHNKGGDSFVNPYNENVWKYNVEIAKEAVKLGFKEVQFDYVRFPEGFEKRADSLKYTKVAGKSRVQIVSTSSNMRSRS